MSDVGAAKRLGFFFISLAAGAVVFAICAIGVMVTSNQYGAGSPSVAKYLIFGAPAYVVFFYLLYYSASSGRMPWSGRSE